MSTSGIRRLGMSTAVLATAYLSAQRFQHRVDMYYLSSAYKRASKSKNYPFSNQRQNERFQRNYGCDENGVIIAVGSKHRREIAMQSIFAEEKQA